MTTPVPRIEDPPAVRETEWSLVRDFVRAANGAWCVVLEAESTCKKVRGRLRSQAFSALVRGKEGGGFELRSVTQRGVCKVYARWVGANEQRKAA
jgi:hypothetical protein